MTLKIGDRVRIEPLTDNEKKYYPHSWSYRMDQYVGRVTRITDILTNSESKIPATMENGHGLSKT